MKSLLSGSLLPLLAAASPVLIDTIHNDAAPILSSVDAKVIPDSYVVVFKDHVTHAVAQDHHSWVQDLHFQTEGRKMELRKRSQFPILDGVFDGLKHTYHFPGSKLKGYSGHFDNDVIEEVRKHPDVSHVPVHCSHDAFVSSLSPPMLCT